MNTSQVKRVTQNFMSLTLLIFEKVKWYIDGKLDLTGVDASELLKIAANMAAGGVNIINTLRSGLGMNYIDNRDLYEAQLAYENMRGLLIEIDFPSVTPNYDALLSSSAGAGAFGAPLSNYENTNPFTEMFAVKIGIPYTAGAATSMKFLADIDTVLYPVDIDTLVYHMRQVSSGVTPS